MSTLKIALVTGAYRGLGLETCRQLAAQGLHVILTSRSETAGRAATKQLADQGYSVSYHPLDVTDPESISRLVEHIRSEHDELDILVNNAGVFLDPKPDQDSDSTSIFNAALDTFRTTLETNTYGPIMLCQQLIPLMNGNGRVVNVSSGMGQLTDMEGGFAAYRLSKTALNAVTRIFAAELADTGIKVNSVCPGWVRTDMGGASADLSPEEGADTIVWLATLPDDGPSGGFFRNREPIAW
ncbi:MAG: SDR family oxidoreductase [Chromatiales bacterium]|nr:SDR family oxidoreductase [Chromatiales bacterium]